MSSHPRLVRGVTLTRRQIGPDEVFYLVKDPNKGIYLRMGEVEAAILKLLDGSRASPELSRILHDTHGHEVDPSAIDEFLELLARRGLVQSRVFDPAAFRREWLQQQRSRRRTLGRLLGSLTNFKVRLFNPQRLFDAMAGPLGFLWTPTFVAASSILMAAAALLCFLQREDLLASLHEFYLAGTASAGALAAHAALMYAVFFIVVAVHETAHGLTCVRFGGRVTDMGFILFYLQVPGFYCDITDAYSFEKRSHRLWTTIAGGWSGLVLASIGAFAWWMTEPGDLIHGAGLGLMIVGGPPLLVLNWNPLMRLDGYYILMDLLEAPNLMDNSQKYVSYIFKSRVLRLKRSDAPAVPPRLRMPYLVYGTASLCFLAPLIAAMPFIIYYVFEGLLGGALALILAVVLGARVLMGPAASGYGALKSSWASWRAAGGASPAAQAGAGRLGLFAAGGLLLLVLMAFGPRFAVRVDAVGELEPLERIEVRAMSPGFVDLDALAGAPREGDRVAAGDRLVRLSNPELMAERRAAEHGLDAVSIGLVQAQARGEPAEAAIHRAEQLGLAGRSVTLARRGDQLDLRAPIDGVVLTPRLDRMAGAYLHAGEVWCTVGRVDRLRVRLTLREADLGVIREGGEAAVRPAHMPGRTFPARVGRMPAGRPAPAGHPEMQMAGVGAAPAPRSTRGQAAAAGPGPGSAVASPRTIDPRSAAAQVSGSMEAEIVVDNPGMLLRPGMKVRVRAYGERLTAAGHVARWAHRFFKGKIWW